MGFIGLVLQHGAEELVIVGSAFWKKCLKGGEENGVEFGYVCSKLFVHDVIFSDESGLKTINP